MSPRSALVVSVIGCAAACHSATGYGTEQEQYDHGFPPYMKPDQADGQRLVKDADDEPRRLPAFMPGTR